MQPSLSGAKAKILIIDDDPANIHVLIRLLKSKGFESCVGFVDPVAALAEFASIKPDLLLLDWHMETLSGLEVLQALRAKYADSLPPVIVLTADCCPDTKNEALSEGASDFLSKPFDQAEVLLRIRNLLRLQELMRHVEAENQRLEEVVSERTTELRKTIDELQVVQRQVIEQDRMRALAEMAGGVAHDFNNSLMVIRGYSELYGSAHEIDYSVEEMLEAFDTIALASQDAGEIVRRLREFYQPFNNGGEERQNIDINTLVKESVGLAQPKWETQTRANGLCVSVELDLAEEARVLAAPTEIREIMINVIFNAVDAMPQGGQITIRTKSVGGRVLIEIEDTGTGMTETTRQRCLEPFYTTKGDRGTGLGLSIIYGILHRHGGSIVIRSELNRGTCITLSLPQELPELTAAVSVLAGTLTKRLRILMVDDDPMICTVIGRCLEGDNHTVTLAANGCEALEMFNRSEFDLVITDRVMPKMSGDQLALAIRTTNPKAKIILLTGFQTNKTSTDISLLLSKPATIDSLRRALKTVIDGEEAVVPELVESA